MSKTIARNLDMSDSTEKICRLRAVQMTEDKTEISQIPTSRLATHFTYTISEEGERKMTPWLMEKCIQQQIDKRSLKIRTSGKNSYLIQVDSEEQSKKVMNIKQINNIDVEIEKLNYKYLKRYCVCKLL